MLRCLYVLLVLAAEINAACLSHPTGAVLFVWFRKSCR